MLRAMRLVLRGLVFVFCIFVNVSWAMAQPPVRYPQENTNASIDAPAEEAIPREERQAASFRLSPRIGYATGDVEYSLKANARDFGVDSDVEVSSLLEWPVDGLAPGLRLEALLGESALWIVDGGVGAAAIGGCMRDHDWIDDSGFKQKFSYTESDTERFWLHAESHLLFHIGKEAAQGAFLEGWSLGPGVRYEYYNGTARGVRTDTHGWRITDQQLADAGITQDTILAAFRSHYFLGAFNARYSKHVNEWNIEAHGQVLAGLSLGHDDHVFRKKDAHGKAMVAGLSLEVAPYYRVSESVDFGLSYRTRLLFTLFGDLRQEFYGDDPSTAEDETGMTIDSDFGANSWTHELSLALRVSL